MDTLIQDLRFAWRSLSRTPGFTIVAVLSLAVGIGATTAAFSLVNSLHLRRLGFPDIDRLVDVSEWSATRLCAGCGVGTSAAGYHDWKASARSFDAMAVYGEVAAIVSGAIAPQRVTAGLASDELFPLLGIAPARGRNFLPEEDRVGGAPVVLLSEGLWRRALAEDPDVVGSTLRVNGRPYTVIGVMPRDFRFPEFADLWLPFESHAQGDRANRDYGVVARLAANRTAAQAEIEMKAIAARLERAYPESQSEWTARVVPLRADMGGDEAAYFWLLQGTMTFVLLIACVNLAGLLLARATGRQRELAVRMAAGANRGRLIRLLLTESLLVASLGGLLGFVLALWGVDLAVSAVDGPVPYWIRFGIDGSVIAFCIFITLLTGLAFGIAPAWQVTRPELNSLLREGAQQLSAGVHRSRLRAGLVVAELSLALVLLSGAGLMVKTFLRMSRPPIAYDVQSLLLGDLEMLDAKYDDGFQSQRTISDIIERLERMSGVRAAVSSARFLAGFGARDQKITVEGMAQVPDGASPRFYHAVTPGYVATLGLRMVAGRDLLPSDVPGTPNVVLINQEMARRIWPGESPIGKRIKLAPSGTDAPWSTVVGVVSNTEGAPAGRPISNNAYVPFAQNPGRPVQLLLRTPSAPEAFVPTVRNEIAAVDPDLPLANARSGERDIAQRFWYLRFYVIALASAAAFALLLAMMGIWGIVSYSVAQRTREIGIRIALGALSRDVLVLFGQQGARLIAVGIGLGLAGAAVLTRFLGSLLFGTNPLDPWVLGAVSLLLVLVAALATLLPARRATRIDPMIALRTE